MQLLPRQELFFVVENFDWHRCVYYMFLTEFHLVGLEPDVKLAWQEPLRDPEHSFVI